MPFISFLSDYGLQDEFVGACKGVIAQIAPDAQVIDLTHEIPPFDVRAGASVLSRAVQYMPEGVILGVVDPGVATQRRGIAVEVATGFFVGPDNGLLAPAVAMAGGAQRAVSLTNTEYQLDPPGPTFAGRDVFAPAAAYLANGVSLDDLGETIDVASLIPSLLSLPRFDEGGAILAEVWWVDRYGNCQLNVDPDELLNRGVARGDTIEIRIGETSHMARWVNTYGEGKSSELLLVVDSYGLCSLAYNQHHAAGELGLHGGSGVALFTAGSEITGRDVVA